MLILGVEGTQHPLYISDPPIHKLNGVSDLNNVLQIMTRNQINIWLHLLESEDKL